jgi:hypothetical protein
MATVTALPTATTAWTRTVHAVAAKARATFPSLGGKIEHALALVLAGAVDQPDPCTATHYTVASQSDPTGMKTYTVVCSKPSTCECEDYRRHATAETAYQCKHILAVWIEKRARAQHGPTLRDQDGQEVGSAAAPSACPEAAFSITLKGTLDGHEVLLTARGQTWEEFAANVARLKGMLDAPAAPTPERRAPERTDAAQTPVCPYHGTMKESTKAKGTWFCPAKMGDGSYCTSRPPEKGA